MTLRADLTDCYVMIVGLKIMLCLQKIIISCQKIFGHFFSIRSVITQIVVLSVVSPVR